MKRLLSVVCLLAVAVVVNAAEKKVSGKNALTPPPAMPATVAATTPELLLTVEELAKFDGKDGRPAYIAVEGVVYDVTGVKAWSGGKHKGGMAGTDITAMIAKAPHMTKVLKERKIVGKLQK